MLSFKNVFYGIFFSNFLTLVFLIFNYFAYTPEELYHHFDPSIDTHKFKFDESLTFVDPKLAYGALLQLESLNLNPLELEKKLNSTHKKAYYGFSSDDTYCEKHLGKFATKPDFIFTQKNFVLDYTRGHLVRGMVVPRIGKDVHPRAGWDMPKNRRNSTNTSISTEVTIFFTNGAMHAARILERQFGCLTQIYNHIEGNSNINRKDKVAEAVVTYAKQFEKKPQCFNHDKFFPKTWSLHIQDQCEDFFENHFKGPEYEKLKAERTIVYIRKKGAGSHQGKGVQPVNEEEEKEIRTTYEDGKKCGKVTKSIIIQHYVYNPLLLNGHKFDFRIYMVIGSTNPTKVYYHDGFLRVSLHPYNVSSDDKSVLLTNTALSTKIFDIARKEGHYEGLNETELRNFQMWNFDKLQNYLLEHKMIKNDRWLDEYLRPEFQKAMIHLTRMTRDSFTKRSQTYELFGADFMLDTNLNLWFIECNSGPVLNGSSKEKEIFVTKMLRDQFEIVFGLLKSRSKRIIKFVNKMIEDNEVEKTKYGRIVIKDLEKKKREFGEITQNYLEPEYEPSPDNGFVKIFDDYLEGPAKYAGLIPQECF